MTPSPSQDAAFGFFHDLLVTDRYYLLLENPIRLDLWKVRLVP